MDIIAIDQDDTLNWLTLEIAKQAGIVDFKDIPNLDQIKSKNVSSSFLSARDECFKNPDFFLQPPYGLANDLVNLAKENGFKPTICTKTASMHPLAPEITANKIRFWQKYYPDINMMIVTGEKEIDSLALIDDSLNNCIKFSQKNNAYKPFLVWDHKTGTIDLINAFYRYCKGFKNITSFCENNSAYAFNITKNKNGLINISVVLTDSSYLSDQNNHVFVMKDIFGFDYFVFVNEVDSNCDTFKSKDYFINSDNSPHQNDFYSIIFNNLKIN